MYVAIWERRATALPSTNRLQKTSLLVHTPSSSLYLGDVLVQCRRSVYLFSLENITSIFIIPDGNTAGLSNDDHLAELERCRRSKTLQ